MEHEHFDWFDQFLKNVCSAEWMNHKTRTFQTI